MKSRNIGASTHATMAIVGSIASPGMTKSCWPGTSNLITQEGTMELEKASGPYRPLSEALKTKQTEASSQAEKEVLGGVMVKHDNDVLLLLVKPEIKEEMKDDTAPLSCSIKIPQHHIKMRDEAESNLQIDHRGKAAESQLTELEPQVVKRRRLTKKTIHIEASVPVKKEVAAMVQKERCDGQEANIKSSEKGNVEMDDVWQWMKREIKEETEQDAGPSSFGIDTPEYRIKVKEETEENGQANPGSVQSLSKHSEWAERELQVPKRRRLTQKTMQIKASRPVKTEVDGGVKVKHEKPAEQEVNLQRQEKESSEDDLWLQIRKEIEKQFVATSSASAGTAASPSVGLPDANGLEDGRKLEDCQDPAAEDTSVDAFAKQAATWAKLCLAFRSSQTWSPTRPCCPANFFLASMNGKPSPPPLDAPPCILRLTGRGLRCLQRFQWKKSQIVTFDGDASLEAEARPVHFGPRASDPELKVQEHGVCGRDCMKMWPWMRDLPTRVWAGNGWAFDENGLRRLSSPCGSQAMQGAEVFESVGAAAEEMKRSDEHMKEVAVPAAVGEGAAPPLEGPKPSKFLRNNVAKQSGVPNVIWDKALCAWQVSFPKVDAKGNKISSTNRVFAVKKFMGPGMDEAQADAAALQAAKNFRTELVKLGILSEPKPKDPNFTSEVPGVSWKKSKQKWEVEITLKPHADGRQNKLSGGHFTDKAAAEAKALELRQQHGRERQVKAVSSLATRYDGLPVFEPKVPYPGVTWRQAEQKWHAQCRVGGVSRHFRVKPKDHSEEELQRSFQAAVAWRKQQEKEKGTAVRAKAKPGKKQRK